MVEQQFRQTIKDYALVSKKDKIVLGVSGGPDSICLLNLFARLSSEYKLKLTCCHLNHKLRAQADQEEEFVRKSCLKLKINFISEQKDIPKIFKGDSLEQTARDSRYDFFLKSARQLKAKKLALAQHKDDLAETVLMRLIRGSGLKGLQGFLPKSRFKGLTVIRPLIAVDKKEILLWLKQQNLRFCLDQSNFEDKFFRNRIRLKLIPLLKDLNPAVIDRLAETAGNIGQDYEYLTLVGQTLYQTLKSRQTFKSVTLDLNKLLKLHPAALNNILRLAIEDVKGNLRRLEARHLNELKDLIFHRPVFSLVDLPDLVVKKEKEQLIFELMGKKND